MTTKIVFRTNIQRLNLPTHPKYLINCSFVYKREIKILVVITQGNNFRK